MMTRLLAFSTALACATPIALAHAAPATLPKLLLDELRRSTGSPGMAAAIVKDGKLAWHGESGHADIETRAPVTRDTQFRLGSVSKFVTIAMLARLVDQRKIDLDRPVHAYLPDYPAGEHPFTVLQLSSHTAGIPHYRMPQDGMLDARPAPYTSSAGLAVFRDRPPAHAPGARYLYSTFGFQLLSAVMEKASGKDFLALLDETAALAGTPSLQAERMGSPGRHWSVLYDESGTALPRGNITYKWAGGGLLGNAADVAGLGARTLDPGFISRATYTRFTTPSRLSSGEPVKPGRYTVGVGWRLADDDMGRPYVHHSGVIQGGRANVNVYPGEQAAASLLANMQARIAAELSTAALYDAFARPPARGACLEGERRYRGRYLDQEITGTVRFLREGDVCKTVFGADNALGRALAPGRSGVQMVAYGAAGKGTSYYVTPAGIFTGKAGADRHEIQLLGTPLALALE